MLLTRIILAEALILGSIIGARCQNYESEYNEDVDDRSDYTTDSERQDHPDYSKYFVEDSTNQQQIQGRSDQGFVTPVQFSSFFETPHFAFGGSSNQEVLKPLVNQQKEESATGFVNENDYKGGFSPFGSDGFGIHDYFEQAQKQEEGSLNKDEEVENEDPKPGPNYISHRVAPTKKYNYESEVNSLKQKPESKVSPYQKYSFQPVANTYGLQDPSILHILQNAAEPFNPSYSKVIPTNYEYQPTEVAAEVTKSKQCVRLNKEVSNNKNIKQPMSCYVCKDQKSGAKSEYCSYESEPAPKSYYKRTEYSTPNAPYRIKREESKTYVNPYEEIKAKSHRYYSQPEEFEKDYYKAPDLSKISEPYYYNFDNDENKQEKSYSETQSEELLKKGENCKKSIKNGVTCTVCTDPKSGGNYEQCSYESEPNEKKYAYVKESKYDGDGKPEVKEVERNEESKDEAEESKINKKSSKLEDPSPVSFDDYHLKLFPQFANQESKHEEIRKKPDFDEVSTKKDVEEVLQEFAKKDRSNCKEINKKGMTCYLCVDHNGIKQEECMYVAESRPRRSYIAYHELQHLKSPAANIDPKEETGIRRRRSVDQLRDETSNIEAAIEFVPRAVADSSISKRKRNVNGEVTESTDPQPQFDVYDEDGLYTAETKPVYSKTLGISLPRYMLEKSELEKDFDKSFGLY